MKVVAFSAGQWRVLDPSSEIPSGDDLVWVALERPDWIDPQTRRQELVSRLAGTPLLDVHAKDLANASHPSHFEATSVYDRVCFRGLPQSAGAVASPATDGVLLPSQGVGMAIFNRLLVSVHPPDCRFASDLVERLTTDARPGGDAPVIRMRRPQNPTELALHLVNTMVDSFIELRKQLASQLEQAQSLLLRPRPDAALWPILMHARQRLHALQALCEDQQDAMQEWLDTLHEMPLPSDAPSLLQAQLQRDQVLARARDVAQHVDRLLHHANRLERSAETAVQIHFNAQGQRTNDTMRALTAITAVFLPLNLFTGFFGMNFDHLPLIHSGPGMWIALALLFVLALAIVALFWQRRYLWNGPRPDP